MKTAVTIDIKNLQQVLDDSVASGEECGCQLTIYQDGELACELCAGYTTLERTQRVTPDTLFPIFSVGKGVMTTLIHILCEQGVLCYDDLVVKYWPEYGVNGKAGTTLRDVLSHRAGLWEQPKTLTQFEMFDWAKVTAALAAEAPHDTIGGMHHYHAHTYGVLTGRIAELAAGRPLRELLRELIFEPLGLDRIYFGLPEDETRALAPIVSEWPSSLTIFNRAEILGGLNPSSNGCANASSLARMYASLGPCGLGGVRSLCAETIAQATTLCRCADDRDLSRWDRFGLGYALCGPLEDIGRMFGHGGAVGSEGFYDKGTGLAVGFTKNKVNKTHPVHPTRNAISAVLGIPERVW